MVSDRDSVALLHQRIKELEAQIEHLEQTRDDHVETIRRLQARLYLNKIPHDLR